MSRTQNKGSKGKKETEKEEKRPSVTSLHINFVIVKKNLLWSPGLCTTVPVQEGEDGHMCAPWDADVHRRVSPYAAVGTGRGRPCRVGGVPLAIVVCRSGAGTKGGGGIGCGDDAG